MNMLKIVLAPWRTKPLANLVTILLIAFGVAIISTLLSLKNQLESSFINNLQSIDMVVGAKGSPLQLVLANVFHVDNPTGNIKQHSIHQLKRNPLVKNSLEIAYGDYVGKYRLLGADENTLAFYKLSLQSGRVWQKVNEVFIGANVAKSGIKLGDSLSSSHAEMEGEQHADKLRVVGVLKQSGGVCDNLIFTSLASVWSSHAHEEATPEKEITALLIKFRSPLALLSLPRLINATSELQAVLPSIEINRMLDLLGIGITGVQMLGAVMLVLSMLAVFLSMLQSIKDRSYELALMRVLGARPRKLFFFIQVETSLLAIFGVFLGLLLQLIFLVCFTSYAEDVLLIPWAKVFWQKETLYLSAAVILLSNLAGLIPAINAYRISPAKNIIRK